MILNTKYFEISGVKLFTFKNYSDIRGDFSEVFKSNLAHPEFSIKYCQENESISNYGVFRGMHLQKDNYSQSKLIRIVKGRVIDVFCDLRKSSETFKKLEFLELHKNQTLFLPKGLAHGFLSLENDTILNYKCDNFYNQRFETGFNLIKSKIQLKFPIKNNKIIMSKKDESLPELNDSYVYKNL